MGRTVLIVDDSKAERVVLTGFLKSEYAILEAANGEEAIDLLSRRFKSVSAVVMDVMMPGMDGFETLRRIKSNAIWRQIPVIITTALDDEESREKAIILGADNFVTKPFNRALLLHIVQNAVRLRETAAMANALWRDNLTGLLNRESFFTEAERMIKRREAGYYMLTSFDVENFKVINDQYGTDAGDAVLKHIADCLSRFASENDGLACRYTSDKFTVLFPARLKDSGDIPKFYDNMVRPACLNQPVRIRVGRYLVSDRALPVSAMYDRASMAERSVKGKFGVYRAQYSEAMRDRLLQEQRIVNDMEKALANGEFEAWFQPQYNHATGALIGSEALVRWRRNGKIAPPDSFIPVFERNGFIYKVDQYIWRFVCARLRGWLDEGKSPLPVSVNISRYDIYQSDFLSVLPGIVKEFDLPAELMRLEITESAFADTTKVIVGAVKELIARGFTVEIDDFGSGYSSLNTLKDVPATILKLDMRFFESGENSQRGGNIVESMVRMAKWLGMAVIAEGVEDKEQADYLKSVGCYYIQGYFYAKPMPLADYEKLMEGSRKEPRLSGLQTLATLDNDEFWNPKSMETLIFNSYVGGACIFEFCGGKSEVIRVNDQYIREMGGLIPENAEFGGISVTRFLDEEGKEELKGALNEAIEQKTAVTREVRLSNGRRAEYLRVTARVIASTQNRYMFYAVILNVTRQREAERERAESARRLEAIMGNVNGSVAAYLMDDNGNTTLIFGNDKYYEIYGYTKEQAAAVHLDVMSCVIPEDFDCVVAKLKRLKRDGKPVCVDYRAKKRDGGMVYIRSNSSRMSMEGRGDQVIVSVNMDISEKLALEDQFRAVVENINGGVAATHMARGKLEYVIVNDRYYDIIGYTKEQLASEVDSVFDIVHPLDRERVRKLYEQAGQCPMSYTMEYRVIRRNGAVRYVLCNTNVIRMFGIEDLVQLTVMNDVTVLREAQKKERETAARLQAIIANIHGGVTACVYRGKDELDVVFSNDGFYEMYGYTKEQLAAELPNVIDLIVPEDRAKTMDTVARIVRERGSETYEYRCRKRDGGIMWTRVSNTVISMDGVGDTVLLAVATDITDEKEAGDQLKFLNDSAHDILAQPDTGKAIDGTLRKLARYFRADRGYVVEFDNVKGVSRNTYEVCAVGVRREADTLCDLPFKRSETWWKRLSEAGVFVIEDAGALSGEDAELKRLLERQNIRRIIIAPLWRDGRLIGFVGVDNPERGIRQARGLAAVADYVSVLLTRRDLGRKIDHDTAAIKTLMDDTPGGFCRMEIHEDKNPTLVSMNDGFCRLLGMTRDEVTRVCASDMYVCLVPEDVAAATADSSAAFASRGRFSTKCRLRRKDGSLIWVAVYGRFVRDESGALFLNSYFADVGGKYDERELQAQLLDNLPVGAALFEYDGRVINAVHINREYMLLVNRTVNSSLEGFKPVDFIHPDDREAVFGELADAIAEKRDATVEIRLLYGAGEYRVFRLNARVTPIPGKKYLLYVAYSRVLPCEVNFNKLMPRMFSTIMESTSDLAFAKDVNFRYLCCSKTFAALVGLKSETDVVGKTDFELFPKDVADAFRRDDESMLKTQKPRIDILETLPSPDGALHYTRTSKYLLRGAVGEVAGLYCVGRDVTRTREAYARLKLLTNSLPGGIATFHCVGNDIKLVYFNDGYCSLCGYTRREFTDKRAALLETVLPEDRHVIDGQIARLIKDETPIDCDFRVYVKDGGYIWVNCKGLVVDRLKDTLVVNVLLTDVSERQEEKERLRVSEEINRLAIELSGNIVTQFDARSRTLTLPKTLPPIYDLPRVLCNMPEEQISLGRVSIDTAPVYRELFEGILRGKPNGTAVYKQISKNGWRWLRAQYATVFADDGTPVSAVVTFTDVTEEREKEAVYSRWQTDPLTGILNRATFASRVDQAVSSSPPDSRHALIMLDIDGFKRVNDVFGHGAGDQALIDVANMLTKASRKDDLAGRLGGDEFMLFLRDIPDEEVAAKKAGYICEMARKAYSNEVSISASVGIALYPQDGKNFDALYKVADKALYRVKGAGKNSYAFSRDEAARADRQTREANGSNPVPPPKRAIRRMLIVDDSKIDQAYLCGLFKDEFKIEEAMDGETALKKLRHYGSAVSVILLDLVLPGMSGFEVLRKIRECPDANCVPVIVVTADERRETSLEVISAGASDLVTKPVDPDILRIRVRSAVCKAENERLLAQNSFLAMQSRERDSYRTALERSGIMVITLDWASGSFSYGPDVSRNLAGRYDGRGLWRILLSDLVADSQTVRRLQSLTQEIAEDRGRDKGNMTARLKTNAGGALMFDINIFKEVNDFGLTDRLIMTLREIKITNK